MSRGKSSIGSSSSSSSSTLRAYVRAAVRHPAAMMVTGVLVAYLAFTLLLQGRVLPLTVLLLMGAIARLATDNMTVVFLSALTACGLYLVLQPMLLRHMRNGGREGLASGGEAGGEEEKNTKEEAAAATTDAAAPAVETADATDDPAANDMVIDTVAPTLTEQKISALQTRVDAVQAELDAAAKKTG
jgi:hypothetical protein